METVSLVLSTPSPLDLDLALALLVLLELNPTISRLSVSCVLLELSLALRELVRHVLQELTPPTLVQLSVVLVLAVIRPMLTEHSVKLVLQVNSLLISVTVKSVQCTPSLPPLEAVSAIPATLDLK